MFEAGVFSFFSGLLGKYAQEVGFAIIGGVIVACAKPAYRLLVQAFEWARAKYVRRGSKEQVAKELADVQQAYNELAKKFAEVIKTRAIPAGVRIRKNLNGDVLGVTVVDRAPDAEQPLEAEDVTNVDTAEAVEGSTDDVKEIDNEALNTEVRRILQEKLTAAMAEVQRLNEQLAGLDASAEMLPDVHDGQAPAAETAGVQEEYVVPQQSGSKRSFLRPPPLPKK